MLALVVAAALAQSPTSGETPSIGIFLRPSPGGLKPALREAVLTTLHSELGRAGFPVTVSSREADKRLRRADAEACTTRIECLHRIGRTLGVDVLVAVEATDFEGDVAVALDAVAPNGERTLARHSAVIRSADVASRFQAEIEPFVEQLRGSLATKPADAPLAVSPPPVAPSSDPSRVSSRGAPSPIPAYAAAGGAALAGGAAVLFARNAFANAAIIEETVPGNENQSPHTWQEVMRATKAQDSNRTLSIVSAGVSAALTAAAVYFWPKPSDEATGR